MKSKVAYIYSDTIYPWKKKISGIYPLERLIYTLEISGIEEIYLDLSDEEKLFYDKKIRKFIAKRDIEVIIEKIPSHTKNYYSLPSNLFMQRDILSNEEINFNTKNSIITPVLNENQFLLHDTSNIKQANKSVKKQLIDTTVGFFAREINKKISVPISQKIAGTRIHPNTITILNFIFGLYGVYLIYKSRLDEGKYIEMAIGGIIFQLVSVFDGVDGEVAKFTFKSSKFGGWLDTTCDHLLLPALIYAVGTIFLKEYSRGYAIFFSAMVAIGIITLIFPILTFLKKSEVSQSFKTYTPEFLEKLPQDDIFVFLLLKFQYLVKKEFYSYIIMIFCLIGKIHWLIPFYSIIIIGSIIAMIVNKKYLDDFIKNNS